MTQTKCEACGFPIPAGTKVDTIDGVVFHPDRCPGLRSAGNNVRSGVKRSKKKSKASGPSERDLSKSIEQALEGRGVWNTRTQSGAIQTSTGSFMQLCRKGTPDRIAAADVHIWLEIKRPGEKPSIEQAATIELLKNNGALVFVVEDVVEFDFLLSELKKHFLEASAIAAAVRGLQLDLDLALQARKEKQNGK